MTAEKANNQNPKIRMLHFARPIFSKNETRLCFYQLFFKDFYKVASILNFLISKLAQDCNWENIGPRSFVYRPRCTSSLLLRPGVDTLPEWPLCLVNKTYFMALDINYMMELRFSTGTRLKFFVFTF